MRNETDNVFRIPITDELDLHTFRPQDIKSVVNEYIIECLQKEIHRVRIIHGKGKSVNKKIVTSLLSKHPDVLEFFDAPPGSGSWGATIALLKSDTNE
jgi:DNA-nicking Smr family endonuclease